MRRLIQEHLFSAETAVAAETAAENGATEKQMMDEACDPRYWKAGRDTALEALHGNEQAVNMNLSRRPENQPNYVYESEHRYKVLPDLALPKTQWTIPRWPRREN